MVPGPRTEGREEPPLPLPSLSPNMFQNHRGRGAHRTFQCSMDTECAFPASSCLFFSLDFFLNPSANCGLSILMTCVAVTRGRTKLKTEGSSGPESVAPSPSRVVAPANRPRRGRESDPRFSVRDREGRAACIRGVRHLSRAPATATAARPPGASRLFGVPRRVCSIG